MVIADTKITAESGCFQEISSQQLTPISGDLIPSLEFIFSADIAAINLLCRYRQAK